MEPELIEEHRLHVITGGPYSGKTSVIEALAQRGYAVVPEAAIQIIGELNDELGVEEQREWRQKNLMAFQHRIAERQAALEAEARVFGSGDSFCDRGLLDGGAYLAFHQQSPDAALRALFANASYGKIFLLDTLREFRTRTTTGRQSTRDDSVRIRNLLREAYETAGYTCIDIPEMPVSDRVDVILVHVGLLDEHVTLP